MSFEPRHSILSVPGWALPFLEPLLPYYDPIRGEPEFTDLLTDLDLRIPEKISN